MSAEPNRPVYLFSVNRLWQVSASSLEEAIAICNKAGIEPESIYQIVDMDCDCSASGIVCSDEDPA